ncbi:MAG: PQQ-dependent sugar dehydrogenase [Nitrosopumilaceae archaeon]
MPAYSQPSINDSDFVVQKYVSGICCGATTMAFEGNDILVLEKVSGEVHLIRNGIFQSTPLVKENVTSDNDQGMLGIDAVGKKVYLYFTESSYHSGPTLCNCVYSYDWDGQKLVNKTLVKIMPHFEIYHIGGIMTTDLNGSTYLVVGDNGRSEENKGGVLENNATGAPDDTGVILRLVPPGPYYAIGIRNSFGLTVDPVTGNLWDTENGPDYGDEINLVPPNFNSGWAVLMGPANNTQLDEIPHYKNYAYHDPQFTWEKPVAPTAISFVNSDMFEKYKNSVLVGDCNNGNLYKFELNQNRDGFVFQSDQLKDNVVNTGDSMNEIILGSGFGCMTDIKVGPDGLLYIVSLSDGVIYRIVPKSMIQTNENFGVLIPYIAYSITGIAAVSVVLIIKKSRKNRQIDNLNLDST